MIYEEAWLTLFHYLNESWKNFGDIHFAPKNFLTFFKCHKIPWLFQVSRNSRSAGHSVLICKYFWRQVIDLKRLTFKPKTNKYIEKNCSQVTKRNFFSGSLYLKSSFSYRLIFFIIFLRSTALGLPHVLPLHTSRTSASEGRFQGKVYVLFRI